MAGGHAFAAMRVLLVAAVALLVAVAAAADVRGVRPSRAAAYTGATFTCLDRTRTVPFAAVNDDYCDCADGSDEPGTAACPNGQFYCANKGHQPTLLRASRVLDGVCDCCDGSDEAGGHVRCLDTCAAAAEEARRADEAATRVFREGFAVRQRNVGNAKKTREDKTVLIAQKRARLIELDDAIDEAKAAKETLELAEKTALDAHKAAHGSGGDRCARLEKSREALRKEIEDTQSALRKLADSEEDAATLRAQIRDLEYGLYMHLDEDERALAADDTPALPEGTEAPAFPTEAVAGTDTPSLFEQFAQRAQPFLSKLKALVGVAAPGGPSLLAEEGSLMPCAGGPRCSDVPATAAQSSRETLKTLEDEQKRLQGEIEAIEKELNADYFGADLEFYDLFEKCFSYDTPEYTYDLCPFKQVTQRSKNGGGSTRLGAWTGWKGLPAHDAMLYEHGDKCWQGPERSTLVKLSCGSESKVTSVTEPAKCEYHMTFETAGACEDPAARAAARPVHDEL